MGLLEGESAPSQQQPEGGLLALLGDMLFAGAVLVMMYPSLRRTINRIDRHFCRQFWHITEVLAALAALSFVLMLMVAQQTRVTYCTFIRPVLGEQPKGDVYAGILLKVVVCALMVFNYFCASGLQRLLGIFFPNIWSRETRAPGWNAASYRTSCRHRRSPETPRETLSNSNSNSRTPVPPSETYSDIFSTVSSLVLNSDSYENIDNKPRLFCDVGTMVRFPEYQRSVCTLQFCQGQMKQGFRTPNAGSGPISSFRSPLPLSPSSHLVPLPMARSTGFCTLPQASYRQKSPAAAARTGSDHHQFDTSWVPISPARDVTGNCERQSEIPLVPRVSISKSSRASSRQSNNAGHSSDSSETLQLEDCSEDPGLPEEGEQQQQNLISPLSHDRFSSCVVSPACSEDCASLCLPRRGSRSRARRRRPELPTMIKMTRSGKIYGGRISGYE